MDWYAVEDILLDGSKEEIAKVKCPNCGGSLQTRFSFSKESGKGTLRIFCKKCHIVETLHKVEGTPNCVTLQESSCN